MILQFSTDLRKQEIFAHGDELAQRMGLDQDENGNRVYHYPKDKKVHVATLDDPVLVTDNYRFAQLTPSAKRDTVFGLFDFPVRTTVYDGTELEFEQAKYPGVWGPSIDTLLFCKALHDHPEVLRAQTATELGSGSGFISKYVMEHATDLQQMLLVDLNSHAIQCAEDNINDDRADFAIGDALEIIKDKRFDLLLCNPPYIPRPRSYLP